ncbi:MAG: helix-turn-helix domain-containing protein [Oceanicoccus sp.]
MKYSINSLEDVRQAVNGVQLSVRQLSSAPVSGWVSQAQSENVLCSAGRTTGQLEVAGALSETHVTFGIVLCDGGPTRQFGQTSAARSLILFPPAEDSHSVYTGDLKYVSLAAPKAKLLSLADKQELRLRQADIVTPQSIPASDALLSSVLRLHSLIGGLEDRADGNALDDLVEETLCAALDNLTVTGADNAIESRQHHYEVVVRQCWEYVDSNKTKALTVKNLADTCGVTRITVHRAFLTVLGTPPSEFIRAIKLSGFREELLASYCSQKITVTELAGDWGFDHLGRLSTYYQRAFGELPSETLRKTKKQATKRV